MSEYLRAFARQTTEGLWLTGLSIAQAGNDIVIQGRTLDADLVPVYLQRLRRETALRGHGFESLSVSQPPPPPGSAGRAPPGYLEFRMATSDHDSATGTRAAAKPGSCAMKQVWQQWAQAPGRVERARAGADLPGRLRGGADRGLRRWPSSLRSSSARCSPRACVDQQAQLIAADAQKQALARTLAQDPDAPMREQIAGKQRELTELDNQLAGLQRTLIGPGPNGRGTGAVDRPRAWRAPGVAAQSPRRAAAGQGGATSPTPRQAAPATRPLSTHVYKHGVEVVVEGSYASLLAYVARLEHQPWQVYWGKTVLSADYPKVVVALTLYTLSLDRAWLVV